VEALTSLLRLDTFSWIVHVTHIKQISQLPTLVAAHQAEVRRPPVGRGPQVENRCCKDSKVRSKLRSIVRTIDLKFCQKSNLTVGYREPVSHVRCHSRSTSYFTVWIPTMYHLRLTVTFFCEWPCQAPRLLSPLFSGSFSTQAE